jgi:hypothetical protein
VKFIVAGGLNMLANWKQVQTAAVEADQLGFWGFVLPDHYVWGADREQERSQWPTWRLSLRGPESKYEREEYQKHVEAASEAGSKYFVTPFPATNYLGSLMDFAENIIPSYAK